MDSAVGVPSVLAEKERDELTPMMQQYVDLCNEYDSELLLFHVGDFYKAFGEAAETVARLCELTLTTREDNTGEYDMAGLRIENAETHLQKLLEAGFRVAIAEQVEDPEEVSGVAERAVTRVITPGTLTESELLDPVEHNFVMSITKGSTNAQSDESEYGIAFVDVSTGAFYATTLSSINELQDEVSRVSPVEVIVGPNLRREIDPGEVFSHVDCEITEYGEDAFEEAHARSLVAEYFGQLQGSTASASEVRASGALLDFAEYARAGQNDRLDYITQLTRYTPDEYMQLDDVALRGLELFERRAEQSPEGATLIDVVDDCVSALGSRRLREWIRRPLVSQDRIEHRLNAVEELTNDALTRAGLREHLERVYDIERLSSKVTRNRADARDIRSLHETLAVVPELKQRLEDCESELLTTIHEDIPLLEDVRRLIDAAIQEDPASELTEGGIIREGYSGELDELRETVRKNREWISTLEESERERTGIDNLSVGHTEVHGYYIEVTESHLDKVPDDYTRRQTLKQSERFYTPELKEREEEIIAAEQRANDLEYELFTQVRDEIGEEAERLQSLADHLARLDALANYAEIAAYNDYTRPVIEAPGSGITIEEGRHPVVEQTQESFVPNDTALNRDRFLAVITGPNMSGKSTYLRQVALIAILAQSGSFVPASAARIGIIDRIFTRIGASDDITGGRSTFMVEMTEVADILEGATQNSLVLLDEVGRGTSTADGYAIACAVTRYIHEVLKSTTLFATHHHELTEFIEEYAGAFNLHFSAEQREDEVVFHYNIAEGPATASYGVEVAQEAGLPDRVIREAQNVLSTSDSDEWIEVESVTITPEQNGDDLLREEILAELLSANLESLLRDYNGETLATIIQEIERTEVNEMTPIEALELLHELQRKLQEE